MEHIPPRSPASGFGQPRPLSFAIDPGVDFLTGMPVVQDASDTLPDYNPDDYRWVPVRRRPRSDGWTEEKQRRFIEVLADTGLVTQAAKAVGMSRQSANKLRRSPHGASFAAAWSAARQYAGGLVEDIAFDRVIEGEERPVHNEYGDVVCIKRVYSNGLLTFLLRHLKPEVYGAAAQASAPSRQKPAVAPHVALEDSLREMEPPLPAPPEQLLGTETLEEELFLADVADGELPHFLNEQAPVKTEAQETAEEEADAIVRGAEAAEKMAQNGVPMTDQEWRDACHYLDPASKNDRPRKLYR